MSASAPSSSWPPAGADPSAEWKEGVDAGPLGLAADAFFEARFRSALVRELGRDAPDEQRFAGIIALVRALSTERGGQGAAEVSAASRRVLLSLFPDLPPRPPAFAPIGGVSPSGRVGLLYWFELLFATPFPAFSAKLNAWVTWWAAQWLMGPCVLEDLEDGELNVARAREPRMRDGKGQVVLVQRCRFLEEAGCASVCVNACKMPTQTFFNDDMGVPMRMIPDYETLQCRFQFGVPPTDEDEAEARAAPCFGACPTLRFRAQQNAADAPDAVKAPATTLEEEQQCAGMGGGEAQRAAVETAEEAEAVARRWRELHW